MRRHGSGHAPIPFERFRSRTTRTACTLCMTSHPAVPDQASRSYRAAGYRRGYDISSIQAICINRSLAKHPSPPASPLLRHQAESRSVTSTMQAFLHHACPINGAILQPRCANSGGPYLGADESCHQSVIDISQVNTHHKDSSGFIGIGSPAHGMIHQPLAEGLACSHTNEQTYHSLLAWAKHCRCFHTSRLATPKKFDKF